MPRGVPKYHIEMLPAPETFYWGPEIDRDTALSLGRLRFFTGEPCKYNHVAERWTKSGMCIECRMRRNRLPEYREYATPYLREYAEANPDKVEAYNAQRRARAEAIPPKSQARRDGLKRHWVERRQRQEAAGSGRKRPSRV